MRNATLDSLCQEREDTRSQLRELILLSLSEQAHKRGIDPLIREYIKKMALLEYLNDLPYALIKYKNAVIDVADAEVVPVQKISESYIRHNHHDIKTEIIPNTALYEILLEAYNNQTIKDLYQTIFKHSHISLWNRIRCFFSPKLRNAVKEDILDIYARILKSDEFNEAVRRPIKQTCLPLLDVMEEIIGKGVFVRPDTKVIKEDPDVRHFIGTSRLHECTHLIPESELKRELMLNLARLDVEIAELEDKLESEITEIRGDH